MSRKILVIVALVTLFGPWAYSDTLFPPDTMSATQVKVRDGDTIVIAGKDIRLYGIDAPEYHQSCQTAGGKDWPCGEASRTRLVRLIGNSAVTCLPQATDTYGRAVARCSTPSVPDIGLAMVDAGLAINGVDGRDGPYAVSESLADVEKRGLWQGPFTAPDEWRKANPRQNATNINKDKKS